MAVSRCMPTTDDPSAAMSLGASPAHSSVCASRRAKRLWCLQPQPQRPSSAPPRLSPLAAALRTAYTSAQLLAPEHTASGHCGVRTRHHGYSGVHSQMPKCCALEGMPRASTVSSAEEVSTFNFCWSLAWKWFSISEKVTNGSRSSMGVWACACATWSPHKNRICLCGCEEYCPAFEGANTTRLQAAHSPHKMYG